MPRSAPEGSATAALAQQQQQQSTFEATPQASAWNPLALGAALGLLAAVAGGRPALAADLENGEAIFGGNCTSCHAGGNNSVVPEKKIRKEALEKYLTGGYNIE